VIVFGRFSPNLNLLFILSSFVQELAPVRTIYVNMFFLYVLSNCSKRNKYFTRFHTKTHFGAFFTKSNLNCFPSVELS